MGINRRNFLYGIGVLAFTPWNKAFTEIPKNSLKRITQLDKFCFGSCNRAHLDQPLWTKISQEKPDLFMWLGDIVYCDTTDPDELRNSYKEQLEHKDYKKFRNEFPIVGTWDDHDYGQNNAGSENPIKSVAQESILNFLGEPETSMRRFQEGIYTSYEFGEYPNKAKLILLDLRYHRSENTLLGEEQWLWLEEEFARSNAKIHFIASSLPFVAPKLMKVDHWELYEKDYQRMHELLDRTMPSGLFFLTGDQHMGAQFSGRTPGGLPLYEVMSSGMTHKAKSIIKPYLKKKYGKGNFFLDRNFGQVEIQWNDTVTFDVKVKSASGKYSLHRRFEVVDGKTRLVRSSSFGQE